MKLGYNKGTTWRRFSSYLLCKLQSNPWNPSSVNVIEFRYHKESKNPKSQHGKFIGQDTRTIGSVLSINNFLYMNDGAFVFAMREASEKAAQLICDHFQLFGLTVHTGSRETKSKSKTEAVYFPPSLQAAKDHQDLPADIELDENRFISFSPSFRYLGSIISRDLTDDLEIEARIKKAYSQMGALSYFWHCSDADLMTKYWVYLAGPLNTLLWGAESWSLSARNLSRLRSFHHSVIRRILHIKWEHVREDRITNEEVRARFHNIPDIEAFINRRTWRYIGKVYRNDPYSIPKKLLGAWIHCPRKIGAPQLSCKKHFANVISTVFPDAGNADFKKWAPLALQEAKWEAQLNKYFDESKTFIEYEEDQTPDNQTAPARTITPRVSTREFFSAALNTKN